MGLVVTLVYATIRTGRKGLAMWRRESEALLLRNANDAEKLELTSDAAVQPSAADPEQPYGSMDKHDRTDRVYPTLEKSVNAVSGASEKSLPDPEKFALLA